MEEAERGTVVAVWSVSTLSKLPKFPPLTLHNKTRVPLSACNLAVKIEVIRCCDTCTKRNTRIVDCNIHHVVRLGACVFSSLPPLLAVILFFCSFRFEELINAALIQILNQD